jgi:DNA repair protein RadC
MENSEGKKSFTIRDLPSSERPRERLQKMGAESLSMPELLAAILGRGIRDESVMKTAQRLLDRFGTVENMANASVEELSTIRGIGLAKSCQLKAAFELANRLERSSKNQQKLVIKTPEDAYLELKGKCRGQMKEHFWAIFLNTRNQVIKTTEISVGSLDTSFVHPRELFKEAISASCSSMIVAHNHPSGNPEASQDDIRLSKRLLEAGQLIGIEVIDHIIIGDGKYISLKREGLI